MLPVTLEGTNLGEKQKHFNILVQDTISNGGYTLTKLNSSDKDIDNLFKIDIACKTRNVEYILDVLKCNDMLYVSRALKQCAWLISEEEYANIINPEHLHSQLFPHMLTKAVNKLLLHIRLHLKKLNRVELFYNYLKDKSNETKWLLNCSTVFIENVIENEKRITLKLYKRLCKRSSKFLQYYTKVEKKDRNESIKAVSFLLQSDTIEYLNVMATAESSYNLPSLGKTATDKIMKMSSQTVLDHFPVFMNIIDLPTFTKYIKREEIKRFLTKCLNNENTCTFLRNYDNLKHFIKLLPEEEKFQFVKKNFIDNDIGVSMSYFVDRPVRKYIFYQFAPFAVAFHELKELIRVAHSPAKRLALLSVLITCAKTNPQYTETLLQFYHDNHGNEPIEFKVKFVNKVITEMSTHNFNNRTWSILNKLFASLEVYTASRNNLQQCLKCIILYKILHDEPIPAVVANNVSFDTFKQFQSKLNIEQKNKIFCSLYESMFKKLQNLKIDNEGDFNHAFDLIENTLNLLNDWEMDLKKHTPIIDKIRLLLKIKEENSWSSKDLSVLYKINKSWRKHMFEESILLYPSEEVCLNALKHNPQLLVDHSRSLDALRMHSNVPLRRFLTKLRIYWPHSLAQQWTTTYLNNLNKLTDHKSLFNGLFILLSHKEVLNIAKQYAPDDAKLDLSEHVEFELNIRRNIAKHLHIARPLISLDVLLWYVKEDYLQCTISSLNALIHNISEINSRNYLSQLLEGPLQLQQAGLYLAFLRLKFVELKPLFQDIWENTEHCQIRTYLFSYTYSLLCKTEDPNFVEQLWGMLKLFIDQLSADENRAIFKKMCTLNNINVSVRGAFFMKSFDFFTSLPVKSNFIRYYNTLLGSAADMMNLLDREFVVNKILSPIRHKISSYPHTYIKIMTSYVLHGETEEEQCERFIKVLVPTLEYAFKLWNIVISFNYVMRHNVDSFLTELVKDFCKYILLKRIVVPVKLFIYIRTVIEENLCINTNYIFYTSWKLTTEVIKLIAEYKNALCDSKLDELSVSDFVNEDWHADAVNVWDKMILQIAPRLGPIFVQHLKDDLEEYFPTTTWLFRDAFDKTFLEHFNFQSVHVDLEIMKYMLLDVNFIPSYLIVCYIISRYGGDLVIKKLIELRETLLANPSQEVQFHYGLNFGSLPW